MKTKLHTSFVIRHLSCAVLLAALTLFVATPRAPAQTNVTVSAADFQRLVYSADLHAELALKPELEACLKVLLEMQRRNPNANPAALVGVLTNALQIYRTSEPYSIRVDGSPDEILATYLDALRHVPARTNFIPVNLTMLNNFMLGADDYSMSVGYGLGAGDLIYFLADWGQQHLFSTQTGAIKRQALVDDCVARAQGNPAFASAMDGLLWPETGVWLGESTTNIIGDTNSPLHGDVTMTTLLGWINPTNGSLTVSNTLLPNLFTNEMQTFWDTFHTDLAVLLTNNASQPDLLAYLTNQAAIDANAQRVAAVLQGQPAKLACATAAILFQSKLLDVADPQSSTAQQATEAASAGADIGIGLASLCCEGNPEGLESLKSGVLDLLNMFGVTGESQQDQVQAEMLDQIKNTQTMIGDLSLNMNYRFDRVDQSLTTIFDDLNEQFTNITYILGAQGQQIAQLIGGTTAIRTSLAGMQTSLDRLEQEVQFLAAGTDRQNSLIDPATAALFYALRKGGTMPMNDYGGKNGYETTFYTFGISHASDLTLSPPSFSGPLYDQLTNAPLDANLNCIKQFLANPLGQTTGGSPIGLPLSNPRDWFAGAYAFMQLDVENPMLFREMVGGANDITTIIARGQDLTNFLGSLTFNGNNINSDLWNALENYYQTNLSAFGNQVAASEQDYAASTNFDLKGVNP